MTSTRPEDIAALFGLPPEPTSSPSTAEALEAAEVALTAELAAELASTIESGGTAGDAPDARAGLRVSWPGRLRLADRRVIDVQVRNLSEGGVGLASAGRIPADTVVDFDMSVPPLEEGGDATLVKGAIKTTYTVVRGAELLCGGTWQAPPARVDLVRSWIQRLRR